MSSGSMVGTGVSIVFNAEFPSGTNFSKSAGWTPVAPIGRFAPVMGYSSSDAASISFTIRFSIEEGPVMSRVRQLRSTVYPVPGGYRPTKVTLNIDNYIKNFVGVVSQISDSVPDEAGWVDGEPSVVDVQVTVQECRPDMVIP